MTTTTTKQTKHASLEAPWARLGVLLNVTPARSTPDVERLLLETAKACPSNPRLFVLAVTWLRELGIYVAAHRLKKLATEELSPDDQATLGLILDTAADHGGAKSLRRTVADGLTRAQTPGPLFEVDRGELASLVEGEATETSRRWGRWVQPITLKPDALRPPHWVIEKNPSLSWRAAHKGGLRCSVVEVLRRDLAGEEVSEAALARNCGATLPAVRAALEDLLREIPGLRVERRRGRAGTRIQLDQAA
jgi:hypothetical protein